MSWDAWPTVSLKEIQISEGNVTRDHFLLLNDHDSDAPSLEFSLMEATQSYRCEITSGDITKMAKACRIPLEEFTSLMISALTTESTVSGSFEYGVQPAEKGLQFTWKKVIPSEEIKIKLGSMDFKLVPQANEICNVLHQTSLCLLHKTKQVQQESKKSEELRRTNKQILETLENHVKDKEELEKELFTKFVMVLNKKKDKCRQLKEQLANGNRLPSTVGEDRADSDVENAMDHEQLENSLEFGDSSDDSFPKPSQRVITKNTKKEPAPPQKVVHQKRKQGRSNVASTSKEPDTQELMEDF